MNGQACRFEGERAIELPGLGGEVSDVRAACGEHVVGWADTDRYDTYEAGTPDQHQTARRVGVRWVDDRPIELPTLGGPHAMTNAVNAAGIVVGWTERELQGRKLACRWSPDGTVARVETGLDGRSEATGIDGRGAWIGWVLDAADRYRPIVDRGDGTRWLALPGDSAFPYAIDNRGRIVGTVSYEGDRHSWPSRVRAHLWIDEQAHELDTLVDGFGKHSIAHATAIDDAGTILASLDGPSYPVLLRPR